MQQFISLRLYSEAGASSVIVAVYFVHVLYSANQEDRKVLYRKGQCASLYFWLPTAATVELLSRGGVIVNKLQPWVTIHHPTSVKDS